MFIGIAALHGFFLTWVISLLPAPSIWMIEVVATVIFILALPTTAAGGWLFVLASRYGLFRWDKQ